jgi:hypothetical protein
MKVSEPEAILSNALRVRGRKVKAPRSFRYALTKHVFIFDDLFRAKNDFRTHAFPFFRLPKKYFLGRQGELQGLVCSINRT